jgi:hypothetical protein
VQNAATVNLPEPGVERSDPPTGSRKTAFPPKAIE